jgi:hypothetical protein
MICPYLKSLKMLRNGIPRVYLYFCSKERNSESFSLLLKDSVQNPESLLPIFVMPNGIPNIFLFRGIPRVCFYFCSTVKSSKLFFFHGMVWNRIPRDFCSTEQPEFRRNEPKLFRLFRLPRNNFFVGNFQPYIQYRNLSAPSFGWATHSGEFFHGTFLFQTPFSNTCVLGSTIMFSTF